MFDKIRYKKERVGLVQKNGKTYVKYVKVRRFKISDTAIHVCLIIGLVAVLGVAAKLLMAELETAPTTVVETVG